MFDNTTFEARQAAENAAFAAKCQDAKAKNDKFFSDEFKTNCVVAAKAGTYVGCFIAGYIVVVGAASWATGKVFGGNEG